MYVRSMQIFRHEPLVSPLADLAKGGEAIGVKAASREEVMHAVHDLLQRLPSLGKRLLPEILAIPVKAIENHVHQRAAPVLEQIDTGALGCHQAL